MSESERLRVYWQPGCTSCLAAKQFLHRHGLQFDSINVREAPEASSELAVLGARSVPVVARGTQWVYAQELRDLAAFLGVGSVPASLPVPVLIQRVRALLIATQRFTDSLPPSMLEQGIAGRSDRCVIDLPYHIAQIVEGLLDAAAGRELTFAHFERRPVPGACDVSSVSAVLTDVHSRFMAWSDTVGVADSAKPLPTYYGQQPLAAVLERSAWHVAQHARQLEHLLVAQGLQCTSPLGDRELAGLPLPDGVWDPEIGRSA